MRKPKGSVTQETAAVSANGYVMFFVSIALLAGAVYLVIHNPDRPPALTALGLVFLGVFTLKGLYMLQPNQAALLLLFGNYRGTDRNAGLRWRCACFTNAPTRR